MHFSTEFASYFDSQEMLDIENEIMNITNESSSIASELKRTEKNKVSLFKRNADVSSGAETCENFPSDGGNEPKKRKNNVSSFSSLNPDEKNKTEISRCFLSSRSVSKHNLSELYSINERGKSQVLGKENNSNKSGSGAIKDVSRSMFSDLNKLAYKVPEDSEKNKTSATMSEILFDQEETVDSATLVQPTNSDNIQSKDNNKEIIKKSAVELITVDDYVASFDTDFDDDCEGMFDFNTEEEGNMNSRSPTKPSSSTESFSTDSSMKIPDSKKFSEVPITNPSNSNRVLNSFQQMEDDFDSYTSDLTGIHQSVPVTKENSNESCQSSVKQSNSKSTGCYPSPFTSQTNRVQRQCSTPITQRNKIPNRCFNSDTESSLDLFSSRTKFSRSIFTKVQKRKFPGPAGILPDIPPGTDLSALKRAKFLYTSSSSGCFSFMDEMICSQGTFEYFSKSPWQDMLDDLSAHSDLQLIKRFNIRIALQKTSKMPLPKHIVFPMICVLLTDLTVDSHGANAVFKDETGEIAGMIITDVIEEYKEYLVPSSAIIIKRAEFLFNHLFVKQGNIAAIYSPNGNQLPLQDAEFEGIATEQSRNSSKKQPTEESVRYHQNNGNQSKDMNLNDDYESFLADDMDDLLNSIDDDSSTNA